MFSNKLNACGKKKALMQQLLTGKRRIKVLLSRGCKSNGMMIGRTTHSNMKQQVRAISTFIQKADKEFKYDGKGRGIYRSYVEKLK